MMRIIDESELTGDFTTAAYLQSITYGVLTMATFMLCGFANLASIGIQIGGIGVLAPGQRKNLSELGFKAMVAGTIVSLISACIAGALIS